VAGVRAAAVNWRLKAAIQRACAALPVGGEAIYYSLQRTFGLLRDPAFPLAMQRAAALIAGELRDHAFDIRGKRVMEVGTGWRVDLPIGLFLCGAKSIVTYDIHRHLKPRLVTSAIATLWRNRERVADILAPFADRGELVDRLARLAQAANVREVFRIAGIEYRAPADATQSGLPAASIDLHVSHTVLQHIPYAVLVDLLHEATRVLAPGGLACHHIDLSDQFARADSTISRANFLRYSETEWAAYGANQFAYHNRLRAADYQRLYGDAGHEIVGWVTRVDDRSLREIAAGFPLAEPFRGLPPEMLATDIVHAISRPVA
jgi:SAM-dependent methyltransferase